MKRLFSLLRLLVLLPAMLGGGGISFAQVSEGGLPPSFVLEKGRANLSEKSIKNVNITFDVKALMEEDAKLASSGAPPRVATIIPVQMDTKNSGEWSTLPTGQRVWRLMIEAPGAQSIMLNYDKFVIPAGGKLFIYNPDHSKVLGAYTERTNTRRAEFATEFVPGDKIILEYAEPLAKSEAKAKSTINRNVALLQGKSRDDYAKYADLSDEEIAAAKQNLKTNRPLLVNLSDFEPEISISGIVYAYKDVFASIAERFKGPSNTPGDEGASGFCQRSVNCPEGADWQHEKKGVAATLQKVGNQYYICSGTLVNNTAMDLTPYFLMAWHCSDVGGIQSSAADFNQYMFYFHFEQTGCENTSPAAPYKTLAGAVMKVSIPLDGGSDGLLLLLNGSDNGKIPSDWDVFYNGWDRRDNPATSGVGIHHPSGDYKKISRVTATATNATANMSTGERGATNGHWRVVWPFIDGNRACTEGGSSGSPYFDQNHRVVGTLTGGNGGEYPCNASSSTELYSIYGKLYHHWDKYTSDPANHMKTYLDPGNTGDEYIDGMYTSTDPVASFMVSATNVWASQSITFTDASYRATTWDWTFDGGDPASYSGKTPPAVLYNTPGSFDAKLVINKGASDEAEMTRTITVKLKEYQCPTDVEVGTGTGTSQFPLGISNRQVVSVSIYTPQEIGGAGTISHLAWNAANATTRNRDMFVYFEEVDETELTAKSYTAEVANAKQVFLSDELYYNWTNTAGWNTIELDEPFEYSGTKNLKVIVRVTAAGSGAAYASSGCYYTATTNAHKTWLASGTVTPTGNGTVNSNRPNIKFTVLHPCGTEPAVANFKAGDEFIHFKEGFDDMFPPKDWTINKPGASAQTWEQLTSDFNTIDPTSTHSAAVIYDLYTLVDTWLISPEVAIGGNDWVIDFYALYGGTYLPGGILNFHVSDDNGITWTQEWTTGTSTTLPQIWRRINVNLSAYNGKNVRFAWQYYGVNGDPIGLDGIKVHSPNSTGVAVIYEGESVQFTDLSKGPPVSWEWTMEGGSPASSTDANPAATYMNEGVYPVTLKVTNTERSDTKTVSNAVTVQAKTPEAQFATSSSNGFTRTNYGQHLPTAGGSVTFTDQSLNYPKSWEWLTPGASAESATSQHLTVVYPEGAGQYGVTLKATNSAGTGQADVADCIQVGGAADIWNIPAGDPGTTVYSDVYLIWEYYLTGTSLYSTAIAERFVGSAPGEITRINMMARRVSGNREVNVSIYSDNKGVPGTQLGTVAVNSNTFSATGYTTVTFPWPIGVDGSFFVVIDNLALTLSDDLYITSSKMDENAECTAYAYFSFNSGDRWAPYSDAFAGLNISLNIVPEYTYSTTPPPEITSDTEFKKKDIDDTAGTVSFNSEAKGWSVTAPDWITCSPKGGVITGGSASFTFTCKKNTDTKLRTGKITLNAGGYFETVTVTQGGAPPGIISANYDDEIYTVKVNWEMVSKVYQPGEDISDSAEDDPSFTTPGRRYYPWTCVDVDGLPVWPLGAYTYPNAADPKSFIAFNPYEAGAAEDGILPHRGNKFFASFACDAYPAVPNNDWMISPELNFGQPFKFEFWASALVFFPEKVRILYSTTGNAPANFTNVLATVTVPDDLTWHKYSYTVPANAKYVAFNNISEDQYMLMLDDIFIGVGENPLSAPEPVTMESFGPKKTYPAISKQRAKSAAMPSQHDAVTMKWNVAAVAAVANNSDHSSGNVPAIVNAGPEAGETELRWDDGVHYNTIGLTSETPTLLEVAALFEPDDLLSYNKTKIEAVEIFPNAVPTDMHLKIYQDGQLIHSQAIENPTPGQFNRIELTQPIDLDITKSLMVGYSFVQAGYTGDASIYVAGCDAGPAVAGKGDLISMDGDEFVALSAISSLNYNWNIGVMLSGGVPVKFNVFKNGVQVASGIEDTYYIDGDLAVGGTACYHVTAIYDDDAFFESSESRSVCAFMKSKVTVIADDNSVMESLPIPAFTGQLSAQALFAGTTMDDLKAMVSYTTTASTLSPAGTYPITPVVNNTLAEQYAFELIDGTLTITPYPTIITLHPMSASICQGEGTDEYVFEADATGLELTYQWQKMTSSGSWANIPNETGKRYVIDPVIPENSGYYRWTAKGRTAEATSKEATFKVGIPESKIVVLHWKDVPTINCNPAENGGFTFTSFQWFRNGKALTGATKPYIQISPNDYSTYHCEMTTADNKALNVCEFGVLYDLGSVIAYPNPVQQSEFLTLKLPEVHEGTVVNIYTTNGVLVRGNIRVNDVESTIDMSKLSPDIYVLQVSNPDGSKHSVKIVVK